MDGKNDAAEEAKNSFETTLKSANRAQHDHFYTKMPAVFDVSGGSLSGHSCSFNIFGVSCHDLLASVVNY